MMSEEHLSLKPKTLKTEGYPVREAWFYEENGGLSVYIRTGTGVGKTTIPIASIRAYLRRKDKRWLLPI